MFYLNKGKGKRKITKEQFEKLRKLVELKITRDGIDNRSVYTYDCSTNTLTQKIEKYDYIRYKVNVFGDSAYVIIQAITTEEHFNIIRRITKDIDLDVLELYNISYLDILKEANLRATEVIETINKQFKKYKKAYQELNKFHKLGIKKEF